MENLVEVKGKHWIIEELSKVYIGSKEILCSKSMTVDVIEIVNIIKLLLKSMWDSHDFFNVCDSY